MRVSAICSLLAAVTAGSALAQQALLCPPATTPSAHVCEAFHFHVQMYQPNTRGFIEFYGINQFASQSACDRAREAAIARNLAVVGFYRKRNDQKYEPDRIGPCHCDMTVERTSSNYLNDVARDAQLRLSGDTRMRVRERLLDADVPTDSELMRGADPMPASPLGATKLVPLPNAPPAPSTLIAADLKMPKSGVAEASPMSELPLVEIVAAPPAPPAPTPVATAPTAPPEPASASAQPTPPPTPAPQPVPAPAPLPPATVTTAPVPAVSDDAVDAFITVENDRIQKILAASGQLTDDTVRVKVLEACTKRLQVLSSLRALMTGRLAEDAAAAHEESARLALVAKLFGRDMPPHWAPKDARDVVVDLVADPEKVLRDPRASAEDKRHALYAYLATSSQTDEWLRNVIEALLQ